MIKPIYIHGSGSISIQPTFEPGYRFDSILSFAQNTVPAHEPDYKALIPAMQLRRMNKSMRMAIFASRLALQEAGRTAVDAIITGSGLGCLKDSERFVEALLAEEGESLNPTPFIQSTHNMAAAAIALSLGCKGYNMTYVNNANSFESALLDGMMYLSEHPNDTILLGGVDELGERTTQFWDIAGYLKRDTPTIPTPFEGTATPGEIAAEGVAFFVVSPHDGGGQAYGRVTAVETCLETDDSVAFVNRFLQRNGLEAQAVDALFMGYNGDLRYDGIYANLGRSLFPKTLQLGFKHVLGEYDTVVALALAISLQLLNEQHVPSALRLNGMESRELKRILIYNQRRGKNHALILVER